MDLEKNDTDIITDVLGGDVDMFSALIDRYKNKIFKIVSMHVPYEYVEEVVNDVFFKAYKSLKMFRNDSLFINWLSVITVRSCQDFWRANYRRKEVNLSSFDENTESMIDLGTDNYTPEDAVVDTENRELILKSMDKLKPVERTIITMMYAEDRSVVEISAFTGLSESNVKVTAFRARKKLAEILTQCFSN